MRLVVRSRVLARLSVAGAGLGLLLGGCPPVETVDALFGTSLAAPAIESIAPQSGPITGGTKVTIRGSGFEPGTGVLFGTQVASSLNRVNDNLLEAITPSGLRGPVDVVIVAGDGQTTTLVGAFQYLAPEPVEPPTQPQPEEPKDPAPEEEEAPKLALSSLTPNRVPTLGGNEVILFGDGFQPGISVLFGSFLASEVTVLSEQQLRVTVPAQATGMVDVTLIADGQESLTKPQAFSYVAVGDADAEIIRLLEQRFAGGPRVVSAVATSNTSVRVSFSEPIRGGDATNPKNYQMVIPGGGLLLLDPNAPPTIDADQLVVSLTTLGQADADYLLTVTGMRDLAGNNVAAPDILVNPAEARFQGIAPVDINDQKDSDGDGFADWFEMLGWPIEIELANGTRIDGYVTSDPFNPDTDGDGLNDAEENRRSLDPRTDDTDADQVSDWDETRLYLSNPSDQDSDNDGLSDLTEVNWKLAPTLADTDGDQLDDRDEIVLRNRNPRLADLPLPQIVIGTMNLEVDERFTYTDERGVEQSVESSSAVSFTQSDTTSLATSSTRSNEATDQFSQQIKVGGEKSIGPGGAKISGEVAVGFGQSRGRGYSSTVSEESSSTAQEEYSRSLSEALAISERQSVTRSAEGARLSLDVTIANAGDLAFTIRNIEVSARVQDPRDRRRYLPMATLLPSSGNDTFNIGPAGAQRGPFIFENTEIFPNLAQSLLEQPRSTIFDIANFDIEDEFGRNFAFSAEEINDLTAAIEIDFGDGTVENYRVATASTFSNGITDGITMREALVEILGLGEVTNEAQLAEADLSTASIRNSFGTDLGENGEQVLKRIRGVQTEQNANDPSAKFWVVLSNTELPETTSFGDLVLRPGDNFLIWYVQDTDNDGLFAREEFLYGSSDRNVDTDDDGISDFDEVRTGWLTAEAGNNRRVFSNPGNADTDGDQVPDMLERDLGTDPRSRDTDADGLLDRVEIDGYVVTLFDNDTNPDNNPVVQVVPYNDQVIREPLNGGDGFANTTADPNSDDIQRIAVGDPVVAGAAIVDAGPNGILETRPAMDEEQAVRGPSIAATEDGLAVTVADPNSDDVQFVAIDAVVAPGTAVVGSGPDGVLQTQPLGTERVRQPHRALFASDPAQRDSDADGLQDGREQFLGSRPNVRDAASVLDTDLDGLSDQVEIDGWMVPGVGLVTSDPTKPDTDGDMLPDAYEWAIFSNPNMRDTDGDGLPDNSEFDPDDTRNYYDTARLENAALRCSDAVDCLFEAADTPIGTNVTDADTDNDTLNDGQEVFGWTVRVIGQPIEQVTSDPFLTNSDTDDLSDREEFDNGTNPRNPDTDNDNVSDSIELDQNRRSLIGPGRRNPLRPDQLLRVEMTRFVVTNDGEPGGDGEFQFDFHVTPPNGSEVELVSTSSDRRALVDGDCSDVGTPCYRFDANCDDWILDINDPDTITVPSGLGRQFVIAGNETARIRGWYTERDGGCSHSGESFPVENEILVSGIQNNDALDESFDHRVSGTDISMRYRYFRVEN